MSDAVQVVDAIAGACFAMVFVVCGTILIAQAVEKRHERWLREHKGDGRG